MKDWESLNFNLNRTLFWQSQPEKAINEVIILKAKLQFFTCGIGCQMRKTKTYIHVMYIGPVPVVHYCSATFFTDSPTNGFAEHCWIPQLHATAIFSSYMQQLRSSAACNSFIFQSHATAAFLSCMQQLYFSVTCNSCIPHLYATAAFLSCLQQLHSSAACNSGVPQL